MFHTPPHKQTKQSPTPDNTDKTLSDYIKRKMDRFYDVYPYESDRKVIPMTDEPSPPMVEQAKKRSFDTYANEMVLTKVGPRPRHHAWGEEKTSFAQQIWEEAQK